MTDLLKMAFSSEKICHVADMVYPYPWYNANDSSIPGWIHMIALPDLLNIKGGYSVYKKKIQNHTCNKTILLVIPG